MSTTANAIILGALQCLNVLDPEETATNAMAQDGLRRLNLMMGQWALQNLTIPVVAREVFDLVANQSTYTMGSGGDFNTTRPANLTGAALLLTASDPDTEVPLGLLTEDSYEALQVKALTNSQPTLVYFKPTFPLARVILWPVPDNATNDLVLYRREQLVQFTSLTASYELPPGADEAIEYNLAVRLARPNSVPIGDLLDIVDLARSSLSIFKKSNVKLTDLPMDPVFTSNVRGGYNINTGTGG